MQPSPKSAMAALDLARAAHSALNDLMPKMALAFNGVASLGMAKETEIYLILLEIHCQVNYFDFFMMSRELKMIQLPDCLELCFVVKHLYQEFWCYL